MFFQKPCLSCLSIFYHFVFSSCSVFTHKLIMYFLKIRNRPLIDCNMLTLFFFLPLSSLSRTKKIDLKKNIEIVYLKYAFRKNKKCYLLYKMWWKFLYPSYIHISKIRWRHLTISFSSTVEIIDKVTTKF